MKLNLSKTVFGLILLGSTFLCAAQPTASFTTTGPQCQNNPINFVDNSFTGVGSIVIWIWDFGDGGSSTQQFPSHTFTSSGNFDVTLTVIDSNGDNDVATSTITVQPAPDIDFSITSTDNCLLTTQTFAGTGSISSGSITNYEWRYGDGSISSGQNGSHTYSSTGTYTVTFTATSNQGCESEVSKSITIHEEPVANFEFVNTCLGSPVEFTNTSSISSGNLTYSWDFGDGNSSTNSNPSHLYATAGDFNVTLDVTSIEGGCLTSITRSVSTYAIPSANISANSVCFGESTTFQNNSTGVNPTFLWNFGDGTTSTAFAPTYTYSSPGSYIVTLEVTSENDCIDSQEIAVEVLDLPTPTFFASDECVNNTFLFTNLTDESAGGLTYQWSFGDGNTSTDKNPTHQYSTAGNFTVTLTATTVADGCSDVTSKEVTAFPVPVADFSVPAGCSGIINTFTDNSTISSGSITVYEWNFGDGSVSTEQSPSHTYDTPGTFDVTLTVTSDNGCVHSVTNGVLINDRPTTDFDFSDSCISNDISFTNESSVSIGSLTYSWDFGDGGTSILENPTYSYATPGAYTVTLESRNNVGGCFSTKTKEVQVFEIPVADFTASSVCFGEPTTFTNLSSGNNPSFLWNFGDGTTSTFFEPTKTYDAPGKYVVTLVITTEDNCTRSRQLEVDVFNQPTPSFFASNACLDVSVSFINLTDESAGALNYLWDFGDTQTSSEGSPLHTYDSPGTYTVTLTATTGTSCVESLSKDITIWPLPEPDFSVADVCDGEISQFNNTTSIASGTIASYLWDFGDLTNSTLIDPEKQYLNAGTYDVQLLAVSDNGCQQSIIKQAIVSDLPVADFEVQDVCAGESVQLVNLSRIEEPNTLSYSWDFGDGNTSVATNPNHFYSQPGTYSITLTAVSNALCEDTFTKSVFVNPGPEVSAGSDTLISRGASVQLQAIGGTSYQWRPIDGLSNSNVANPIARPFETTDYIVSITDQFGCTSEDTVRVELQEDFRVVPYNVFTPDGNGQNDQWVIQNADAFEQVQVKVYDRYGVLVFEDNDYQNTWEGTRGQDILPDGTYYYLITFLNSSIKYNGSLTIMRNN